MEIPSLEVALANMGFCALAWSDYDWIWPNRIHQPTTIVYRPMFPGYRIHIIERFGFGKPPRTHFKYFGENTDSETILAYITALQRLT